DPLAPAGAQAVVAGGQRGDGRVPTRVEVGDVAADLDGGSVGEELPPESGREDRSLASGVELDQVVGPPAGVRAGGAERPDGDQGAVVGQRAELLDPLRF